MTVMLDIGGTAHEMASDDGYLDAHRGTFEPDTVHLLRAFARDVVYDVGANVGCTALLFADQAREVHAFEPSPSTFGFLRQNTAGCRNIIAHNVGLGDRNCTSEITFSKDNRSGGFVSDLIQASEGHVTERIELRKLDRYGKRLPPPDFIKIDVEGFELQVLAGAKRIIRKHHPAVVLEMNHWCLNVFRRTPLPDFIAALCRVFPHLYAVDGREYLHLHDPIERYVAMYHHVQSGKYGAVVGAFTDDQLEQFRADYRPARR